MSNLKEVEEKHDFPKSEEAICEYWKKIDAFKTSLELHKGLPEYTFYDGPPFATGLPHYGHILAGTIKDTVTRYAHQTGHSVSRRFGWDCHGLPIEFEIDKEKGIKTKEDVLAYGIGNYNEACRKIVMKYSGEWRQIVTRLGRWIDFDNDYKTMDMPFMESVWWVFKQLSDKNMVYRGFKVMPYSTACTTPLSNFEANSNYKEVQDPAVIVSFPLVGNESVSLIAWTTTPWTLPSNLALCVNPTEEYVTVQDKDKGFKYILMKKRLVALFAKSINAAAAAAATAAANSSAAESADSKPKPDAPAIPAETNEYKILSTCTGSELVGKKYVPLFNYFEKAFADKKPFRVIADTYVTAESGTGIVHQAPAFGEDDYRVCLREGIIGKTELPCPVDDNGRFTLPVKEFSGKHVKEADPEIIKHLKEKKRLVNQSTLTHSYPFCWRSETPLIYKAVPSWFVKVEEIRDKLLKNNTESYWVPDFVQEKRFHNWLGDARDWAISRNRYWGTPLPIWVSDDYEEIVVIGSVKELEELSGSKTKLTDIHCHHIDHLTIPSKKGKGVLRRVPEVFDCWFESGSMPYAQVHYPFENKGAFERGFPADFIAEGIDQTRGWFYTLLVISTALYDKPAFKNLIVNGLVLAADGKKMSKRLKNYPDPMEIIEKYGADALRLYLINSPVVRAEPLKFVEKGVNDIIKDVFLRWYNSYRLFVQNVFRYEKKSGKKFNVNHKVGDTVSNIMDKWVLAHTESLVDFVRKEMEKYRLYTVIPKLVKFITSLANWYVRLNRDRLKGAQGVEEQQVSLSVLYYVLMKLCVLMTPFTPFFTEILYQNLKNLLPKKDQKDSIHYLLIPTPKTEWLNPVIERAVGRMQDVVNLGRTARERRTKPLKIPLRELIVYQKDQEYVQDLKGLESYILSELNVKGITYNTDTSAEVLNIVPVADQKRLGQRLRKDAGKVVSLVKALTADQLKKFEESGTIVLAGHELTLEDVKITRNFVGDTTVYEAAYDSSVLVVLDVKEDQQLKEEGILRTITSRIQKLRKEVGLSVTDSNVVVYYDIKKETEKGTVEVLENFKAKIESDSNSKLERKPAGAAITPTATKLDNIFGTDIEFSLCKQGGSQPTKGGAKSTKVGAQPTKGGDGPGKSAVFTKDQLVKFWTTAPNTPEYLLYKVVSVFGYFGALKGGDLAKLEHKHIQVNGDGSVKFSAKSLSRNIPAEYAACYKQYLALLPKNYVGRVVLTYKSETSTFINSPMGVNTLSTVPAKVAEWLKLEHPEKYTGQAWHRSANRN